MNNDLLRAVITYRKFLKKLPLPEAHRHENSNTTKQYIHAFDEERYEDMQKLKLKIIE